MMIDVSHVGENILGRNGRLQRPVLAHTVQYMQLCPVFREI
jgi:hypothetical protein